MTRGGVEKGRLDVPDGGKGEEEVDETKAEREPQRLRDCAAGFREDR